ncbi:MAG: class I SAM-dependent methyltransferase [Gaiella sp.]
MGAADLRPSVLRDHAAGVLAFYLQTADEGYWDELWAETSLERALDDARRSPVTDFLLSAVGAGDRVLEGGCGLGIYSELLAQAGADVVGIDFSRAAIDAQLRAFPDHDAREGRLEELPFADASFDAYVSLGVIEHDPEGSPAILAEARRILRPDGTLLLSVPYLNLSRRLLRARLSRWQEESVAEGATFYQYALDGRALDALLAASGFRVAARDYYHPGRGLRYAVSLVRNQRARTMQRSASSAARSPVAGQRAWRRAALRWPPTLRVFAHMQIVRAHPT